MALRVLTAFDCPGPDRSESAPGWPPAPRPHRARLGDRRQVAGSAGGQRLDTHVEYLHTKYMIVDPLTDDPLVVTGSANFSDASTRSNDENMLVIPGNQRVADVFLGEFMRTYNHLLRNLVNELSDADFLRPDDTWTEPYYREGSPERAERLLFRCG